MFLFLVVNCVIHAKLMFSVVIMLFLAAVVVFLLELVIAIDPGSPLGVSIHKTIVCINRFWFYPFIPLCL